MAQAELRLDTYYRVTPEQGSTRIIPASDVPELPTAAQGFKTQADGYVLDWSQHVGWFGRSAPAAPWQVFDDADAGMAALGIANLISPTAVVTPPEAFASAGPGVEEPTPDNDPFLAQMLFEEEEAEALAMLEQDGEEA